MNDDTITDEEEETAVQSGKDPIESKNEKVATEESKEAVTKKSQSKKNNEVSELKKKVEDLNDQLLRSVADYRNLSMRFEEEKKEFVKYANRELLLRLIPAFDTLFLAAKYVEDEGIKLTIKHLQEALREVGVENVKALGKTFDAGTMEAVTTGDGEDGRVLEELRPGYTLSGKLIRPAQVKVGKGD